MELTMDQSLKKQTKISPECSTSSSSSSSTPLSGLEELHLSSIVGVEDMPEEWFLNLSSLKTLTIYGCGKLKSIPDLKASTSLSSLEIDGCKSLISLPFGIQNLSELHIRDCGFPLDDLDNVRPLKNLRRLRILYMKDEYLPKCLVNITTLLSLLIQGMMNLKNLPDLPPSLQSIDIAECPRLREGKVRNPEGEDWSKIKHIPNIKIDGVTIQSL